MPKKSKSAKFLNIPVLSVTIIFLFVSIFLSNPGDVSGQWSKKSYRKITKDTILLNYLNLTYSNIQKNKDTALSYADKALHYALKKNDMPAACLAYAFLNRIQMNLYNYSKAKEYSELATSIKNNLNIPELDAYFHYLQAMEYMIINRKPESIYEMKSALDRYLQLKDTAGIVSLYKGMAVRYIESKDPKDFNKAKSYLFKTLDILAHTKEYNRMGIIYSQLGGVCFYLKQYDSADICMYKAIDIDQKYNNTLWLAMEYRRLGEFKVERRQYDSAEYYYMLADQHFIHLSGKADILKDRGMLALLRKRYKKANELFLKAYLMAKENNSLEVQASAAMGIAETSAKTGDYRSAYDYLIEYNRLKDTLQKIANLPEITLLKAQHEYELKSAKILLEKEKITNESHQKNLYILLMAFFSLSLLVISFIIYQYLRLKNRAILLEKVALNHDIDLKNKELTTNLMSLMKKNEMLTGIREKLLTLDDEEMKSSSHASMKRIAKEIEDSTGKEIWEEFELRFRQVHTEFYKNLVEKYTGLTPGEIRLCAFLRLNLSTKEISQLTGQSIKTIEVARTRLRKKLGITDNEINLTAFLSRI
ncbi:MAG: hypothetical protein WCK09_13990 [Bacteroidota bacterium]